MKTDIKAVKKIMKNIPVKYNSKAIQCYRVKMRKRTKQNK